MATFLSFRRESDNNIIKIRCTEVFATGDMTLRLYVKDQGSDISQYFAEHPNDKHYLVDGQYNQYIMSSNVRTKDEIFPYEKYKKVDILLFMTVNGVERNFGFMGGFFNVYYESDGGTTRNPLGQVCGAFLTVNQYGAINILCGNPVKLSVISESESFTKYKAQFSNVSPSFYEVNDSLSANERIWGYKGLWGETAGGLWWKLNAIPSQITQTADEWWNNYNSTEFSYYWINYQNEKNPDHPIQPKEIGFPYGEEPSKPAGGNGDMIIESETIEKPEISESHVFDGGVVSVYQLSEANLQSLANFLWSNSFLDTLSLTKLLSSRDEVLVGLSELPLSTSGREKEIVLGDIPSGVTAIKISDRFIEKEMGEIALNEFWGNFMDYSPYTRIELNLPYCGTSILDPDLFMNKVVKLTCRIDVLTGDLVYLISNGESIIDVIRGNCNSQIPLNSRDYTQQIKQIFGGISEIASGNAESMLNGALDVLTSKPKYGTVGSLVGNVGSMGIKKAFLRITRPTVQIPENFPHQKGFRSNITAKLRELEGFTVVDTCHLDGMTCTDTEKDLLMNILKSGIIL